MKTFPSTAVLATLLFSTAFVQSTDAAAMTLQSYTVTPDIPTQTVHFTLTFSRVPDWNTYDGSGRQSDAFWIDILNHPGSMNVLNGFGGEDRRIISGWLPFWGGTSADFNGYFATATPRIAGTNLLQKFLYQDAGSTVSFSRSFAQLGETDGVFEAILCTAQYGAWGGTGTHIASVPEPSAAFLACFGFGVLALRRRVRCGSIRC